MLWSTVGGSAGSTQAEPAAPGVDPAHTGPTRESLRACRTRPGSAGEQGHRPQRDTRQGRPGAGQGDAATPGQPDGATSPASGSRERSLPATHTGSGRGQGSQGTGRGGGSGPGAGTGSHSPAGTRPRTRTSPRAGTRPRTGTHPRTGTRSRTGTRLRLRGPRARPLGADRLAARRGAQLHRA